MNQNPQTYKVGYNSTPRASLRSEGCPHAYKLHIIWYLGDVGLRFTVDFKMAKSKDWIVFFSGIWLQGFVGFVLEVLEQQ